VPKFKPSVPAKRQKASIHSAGLSPLKAIDESARLLLFLKKIYFYPAGEMGWRQMPYQKNKRTDTGSVL
jgi:hypothetical protein